MPAVSKAQRKLMGACMAGAKWESCKKIRESMSHEQMKEFAETKEKKLPMHKSNDDKDKGFSVMIAAIRRK